MNVVLSAWANLVDQKRAEWYLNIYIYLNDNAWTEEGIPKTEAGPLKYGNLIKRLTAIILHNESQSIPGRIRERVLPVKWLTAKHLFQVLLPPSRPVAS